ncbi:MAG: AAA family ATPase, partial [Pygmaiobacter sp.]|nr:AAA family ATPase [Pygmaiobacter sp.]
MSKRPNRSTASLVILLLLAAVLMFLIFRVPDSSVDMKYSQVLSYFKDEKVKSFTFDLNDGTLTLTMSAADAKAALEETQKLNSNSTTNSILGSLSALEPVATPAPSGSSGAQAQAKDQQLTYKVPYADLFITQVLPYVDEYNDAHPDAPMVYDILPQQNYSAWLSVIPTLLSMVLIGALFWFMMRQSGGGGGVMNVGKVKAKDQNTEGRRATFADVAGADEEKAELQEVVDFLKTPAKFSALGARIPRGVLLVGPPGTGKTLIARACAGEA